MEELDLERLVLPALLALLIVGAFVVLVTSGGGEDSLVPAPPAAAETVTARTNTAPARALTSTSSGRFAKVEAGDTASSIAAAAQISVDRLRELNPSIDLDDLRRGQTLKLAR
ncbi:MAG: LysM peptidoglycan-binding domain-containing protein [Thermoleophilia bacterium]